MLCVRVYICVYIFMYMYTHTKVVLLIDETGNGVSEQVCYNIPPVDVLFQQILCLNDSVSTFLDV